jgi:hypothetical protein
LVVNYTGDFAGVFLNAAARDNCTEPFIRLHDECRSLGYVLEPALNQDPRECERIIFWDTWSILHWSGVTGYLRKLRTRSIGERRNWARVIENEEMRRRAVLILWEPPSVCPGNAAPELYSRFPTVLSWNDSLVDGARIHKFCCPIPTEVPAVAGVPFRDKKLLVNISMNKFSDYPNELYTARRQALAYFDRVGGDQFEMYGVGWDRAVPGYKSYRGTVDHKWEVLPRFKFALCYENASDQPGGITEKIFDCMRADCVPVYWGAPNITDYVDPAAFIDRRQFRDDEELHKFLAGIREPEYARYRESIRSYLKTEQFARFLSPGFVKTVVHALRLSSLNNTVPPTG